jgi:hypothetical protein
MKNMKTFLLMGCLALGCAFLTPKAKAGEWDQKTILTFDQPVEIPGLVLPAGTYVFRLVDSTVDRNIVQVLSQDERKLYATINAIPDYREHATGETTIVYQEGPAGAPRTIKEWFFPGSKYGHEFVYPEMGTLAHGKSNEPESATSPVESAGLQSTEAPSTKNEPDATMEPIEQTEQPEEGDYLRLLHQRQTEPSQLAKADESESATEPAASAELTYLQALNQKQREESQQEQAPTQTAMVRELPRTASDLPLVFLSGILLIAISFGIRVYSKRLC